MTVPFSAPRAYPDYLKYGRTFPETSGGVPTVSAQVGQLAVDSHTADAVRDEHQGCRPPETTSDELCHLNVTGWDTIPVKQIIIKYFYRHLFIDRLLGA